MYFGLGLFLLTVFVLWTARFFIQNYYSRLFDMALETPDVKQHTKEVEQKQKSKEISDRLPDRFHMSKAAYERDLAKTRLRVAIGVTALVLPTALYIIVFTKDVESQKWAIGAIGLLIGYWLK